MDDQPRPAMNQTVKTVLIVAAVLLAIWVGSYLLDALGTHYPVP